MGTYNVNIRETVHYFPTGVNTPITLQLPGVAEGVKDGFELTFINREIGYDDVILTASAGDLIEHPLARGTQAPAVSITTQQPALRFKLQYFGGTWYCMWASPIMPFADTVNLVTPVAVPLTLGQITEFDFTIPGLGNFSYILDLLMFWTSPGGGSFTRDVTVQIRSNANVIREFNNAEANRPTSEGFRIPINWWLDYTAIAKGDVISVWASNNAEGTTEFLADSSRQAFGPMV